MKNYLIISILLDLLKHETIKASNLAAKNEVSVRTIYRTIDALEEAGVPPVTHMGKNGGVGIAKNFKLQTTYLTNDEKNYLRDLLTNHCDSHSQTLIKKLNLEP